MIVDADMFNEEDTNYMPTPYQEFVRSCYIFDEEDHLQYALLNLPAEVGELLSLFAKHTRDFPSTPIGDPDVDYERLVHSEFNWDNHLLPNVRKELGDIIFMVNCLADALHINMDEVVEENMEKLRSRQRRGVVKGSGDNR